MVTFEKENKIFYKFILPPLYKFKLNDLKESQADIFCFPSELRIFLPRLEQVTRRRREIYTDSQPETLKEEQKREWG